MDNTEDHITFPPAEEMPPPLMASSRSDTINSTTVFASLSDIQPHNSHRYTGTAVMDVENNYNRVQHHEQDEIHLEDIPSDYNDILNNSGDMSNTSAGIKRPHEPDDFTDNDIKQCKVIYVDSAGTQRECQEYANDPFDIPLGGSADTVQRQGPTGYTTFVTPPVMPSPATLTTLPRDVKPQTRDDTREVPTATSSNPGMEDYLGQYSFDVFFTKYSSMGKNKHWDYSGKLKKLFIDMNKWVQAEFKVVTNNTSNLQIRVMPVYSEAAHMREPVKRCPNHAASSDPTNINFNHPNHLIRTDNDYTSYERDEVSKRLSLTFPVQTPHEGTDRTRELVKFMCLGSDVGGINRRPLKVIFTLEHLTGKVVGRKVFDVRICSCPRRDKAQEEERYDRIENQTKAIADK